MLNQINSEWIKLKSVRSSMILLIIAVAINVLISFLVALFVGKDKGTDLLALLPGQFLATLFFLVAGVQIIGQEYRFNTIRNTFSSTPNRIKVITAKLIVLSLAVAGSTLLLATLSGIIGKIILSIRGIDLLIGGDDLRTVGYLIIGNIICGFFGFGIGAIVRHPIAGIVIVLVWPTIVENILLGVVYVVSEKLGNQVLKWMPFANLSNAIAGEGDPNMLNRPFSMLYFFAFCSIFVALGSVLIKKRDA